MSIAREQPSEDPDDALPPEAFVRVTALAASLLAVPVALVQTGDRGAASPGRARGIPSAAVAHLTIAGAPAIEADLDVLADPRRAAEELGLAFHASVTMTDADGRALGTLSVFDHEPRAMRLHDRRLLGAVAAVAVEEVEVWTAAIRARDQERATAEQRERLLDDTTQLLGSMRMVTSYEEPALVRPAIARIALDLSGADSAALYELAGDDETLLVTASAGAPWPIGSASLTDLDSPIVRSFVAGKAVIVDGDEVGHPSSPFVTFWQPFAAGGPTGAAAIGLAWLTPAVIAPVELSALMETLAAEGMRAIERADLLVRLEDLARTDELTGLPNRRAMNERLWLELERARREGHPVCVGLLDLDHFKRYNDTRGHPAGDQLLAEAAARWRDALRVGTDILARYGGEEFAIVLPTPIDDAHETIDRLRAATPDGQTASVGLAMWDGRETAEGLVARADAALYAAKAAGRDRIVRAEPTADAVSVGPGRPARGGRRRTDPRP